MVSAWARVNAPSLFVAPATWALTVRSARPRSPSICWLSYLCRRPPRPRRSLARRQRVVSRPARQQVARLVRAGAEVGDVGADGLEHHEAGLVTEGDSDDQALVDQLEHRGQHVDPGPRVSD